MAERLISDTVEKMLEFQKTNCIKDNCMTNVQYLYDCIKMSKIANVKVKPVIVVSFDNETNTHRCCDGHLVIELNNTTIIDPSYDIVSLKNKKCFYNIKDFMNSLNSDLKSHFKNSIANFIHFMKLAEQINNGECLISDNEVYNNQADFVENKSSF
jgi:hypothetical protein